jgi:RNA polymerase sigma-70 factor (ECF subfamily)
MLGIAFKYTKDRDTAVDYMNLGFYKVLRKIDLYDFKTPFDVWARVLIKNTIIDEIRKQAKHKLNTDKIDVAEESIENEAIKKLDYECLDRVLDVLPQITKRIVVMQVLDGFTHKEISKELGISESASKWHLVRGKAMLREGFYMSF